MNDLGLTLAWLAVQVALVLAPALVVQALASRRGPTSGAWVATLSLGLVVVLVASMFVPGIGHEVERPGPPPSLGSNLQSAETRAAESLASTGRFAGVEPSRSSSDRGLSLEELRRAWARFGVRAAGPAAQVRPWGSALAVVALAGSGVGLFRLVVGLWAVGHCRRRGRRVDDPAMTGLLDDLRGSMGCRPTVELREVPDLATPATAGWRRPMLLLPEGWRAWDESERRAVVAHELAHIVRGDYAAGLLARVAVVLNYYHPLVRWMAGRLQLQQELAADALGARFAGGRASYLVALSSLALKQDGRSPTWPARAFLPARGTLIRRIKMLKNENETMVSGRAWSKARRLATALGLVALTIGVATLRGPARAADGPPALSAEAKVKAPEAPAIATPFQVNYIPDGMAGVVAFRPAAIFRRTGMVLIAPFIDEFLDIDLNHLAKELRLDPSRPGWLKLQPEDIESVACGIKFGRANPKDDKGQAMHSIEFRGVTIRTVAPFDWLAFLRQWGLELEEVREGSHVFYLGKGPLKALLGGTPSFYLPDDRTLVSENEPALHKLLARDVPSAPAYLRGSDWERVGRGLIAVAISNQDDALAKEYDLGRPDDVVVLGLFKGVERWTFGLDDLDALSPHAEVTTGDPQAAKSVARSIGLLVQMGRAALDSEPRDTGEAERAFRLYKKFLANLNVGQEGRVLTLSAEGLGTFADATAIIGADIEEENLRAKEAKAGAKAEKR